MVDPFVKVAGWLAKGSQSGYLISRRIDCQQPRTLKLLGSCTWTIWVREALESRHPKLPEPKKRNSKPQTSKTFTLPYKPESLEALNPKPD